MQVLDRLNLTIEGVFIDSKIYRGQLFLLDDKNKVYKLRLNKDTNRLLNKEFLTKDSLMFCGKSQSKNFVYNLSVSDKGLFLFDGDNVEWINNGEIMQTVVSNAFSFSTNKDILCTARGTDGVGFYTFNSDKFNKISELEFDSKSVSLYGKYIIAGNGYNNESSIITTIFNEDYEQHKYIKYEESGFSKFVNRDVCYFYLTKKDQINTFNYSNKIFSYDKRLREVSIVNMYPSSKNKIISNHIIELEQWKGEVIEFLSTSNYLVIETERAVIAYNLKTSRTKTVDKMDIGDTIEFLSNSAMTSYSDYLQIIKEDRFELIHVEDFFNQDNMHLNMD